MGNCDLSKENLYSDLAEKWIRQCIHMGYSPKKLLHNVFNTIDKEINFGEKKYVLYCGSYGGYNYSKEFIKYLDEYHNKKLKGYFFSEDLEIGTDDLEGREIYHYITQFAEFLNVSVEEALEKASGNSCNLEVKKVPKHRSYKIHEYDGAENVEVLQDFNY